MSIAVYLRATWGYCSMLKRQLGGKGIKYGGYPVDKKPIAGQYLVTFSGQMREPYATIEEKDDGTVEKIVGFGLTGSALVLQGVLA